MCPEDSTGKDLSSGVFWSSPSKIIWFIILLQIKNFSWRTSLGLLFVIRPFLCVFHCTALSLLFIITELTPLNKSYFIFSISLMSNSISHLVHLHFLHLIFMSINLLDVFCVRVTEKESASICGWKWEWTRTRVHTDLCARTASRWLKVIKQIMYVHVQRYKSGEKKALVMERRHFVHIIDSSSSFSFSCSLQASPRRISHLHLTVLYIIFSHTN